MTVKIRSLLSTGLAFIAGAFLTGCAGGGGQDFTASLAGLEANASFARTDAHGLLLDANNGWEWFLHEERRENQGMFRHIDDGPDGQQVAHGHTVNAGDRGAFTYDSGIVVYSGAADDDGNPTNLPAAIGTTCVRADASDGGVCDYWQSNDVTLEANLDSGVANLEITEIENRTNDERYRPDGRRLAFSGRVEGDRIVPWGDSNIDYANGRLDGYLGDRAAVGFFGQTNSYVGPRNATALWLVERFGNGGDVPAWIPKEHNGVFALTIDADPS